MNRSAIGAFCLAAVTAVSACGGAPPGDFPTAGAARPGPRLQRLSFSGVADPATGRLQVVMGPQAIGRVPESADGNALTVAANTVQVYGASVSFVSDNALYPAGCDPASPRLMLANVEIFSGFSEQLRNVYANLTASSSGPTFCATSPLGGFAAAIGTSVGAYLYQPLNAPSSAASAIRRSAQWAMSLPDLSAYWFTGEVWAEIVPGAPTGPSPANGAVLSGKPFVTLSWTANDASADGTNPENQAVPRPTAAGTALTIRRCNAAGSAAVPFDPASCTSIGFDRVVTASGQQSPKLTKRFWYEWTLQSSFFLPGGSTPVLGAPVTQTFLLQ